MMSSNRRDYGSASEWLAALRLDEAWLSQQQRLQSSLAGNGDAYRDEAIRRIGRGDTFEFWEIYQHKVEPVVSEVWEIAELSLPKLKIQTIGMLSMEWLEKLVSAAAENTKRQKSTADNSPLSPVRQEILDQLLAWADMGDWVKDNVGDQVKTMLVNILGQGETPLGVEDAKLSEALWQLLENGRGNRAKIVWQNIVGYLDDRRLLKQKGSPALNKDFFGKEDSYSNIDKGRPSRDNMSSGFRDILPLLDKYVPWMDKKA